ncbi:hypothetical protein [Lichenibacterium dinghuense]|uniref:hypothetical protein n=1 Tax=Lichenibacterium dinghuense TaxID=2895977 RepID=UPI001F1E8B21|nr:hypothetical protein [Lichenibacterium sp. 6Y81]
MPDYVVRCSQAEDGSLARRPTAFEAIEVLERAVSQGWEVKDIIRGKRVIDELSLRHDAWQERPRVGLVDAARPT